MALAEGRAPRRNLPGPLLHPGSVLRDKDPSLSLGRQDRRHPIPPAVATEQPTLGHRTEAVQLQVVLVICTCKDNLQDPNAGCSLVQAAEAIGHPICGEAPAVGRERLGMVMLQSG
jgi:hypothetical protein